MQSTLLLLKIRPISLYTFQNVKVKCLIDSLLRMDKFVIDDSFGIEEADPGRREFCNSKQRSRVINIYKFGMFISCSRSSALHQKISISSVPLKSVHITATDVIRDVLCTCPVLTVISCLRVRNARFFFSLLYCLFMVDLFLVYMCRLCKTFQISISTVFL
jgi:hypothetical protein